MRSFPMVPVALFAQVELGEPTTKNGVHAFFRLPSRQNPQPGTDLGKFPAEPVYHGDSARKSGAHAKTGDRLGKNRYGNGLSWRS